MGLYRAVKYGIEPDLAGLSALAEELGCLCVSPEDNELLLDTDGNNVGDTATTKLILISKGLNIVSTLRTVSRNGNSHLYIRLDRKVTDIERICLQVLLGSDPLRESYSLAKWWSGSDGITVLFERPQQYRRVVAWRKG